MSETDPSLLGTINPFAGKAREPSESDVPIVSAAAKQSPLSYQQRGLWFLDSLSREAGAAYTVMSALRLTGPLDVSALEATFRGLVKRHTALRTHFETLAGEPVQVVDDPDRFVLEQEEAEGLAPNAVASRVSALLERPFDLQTGPLFRALLLRLSANEHVLVYGGHHSVLDGWSMGVLTREVAALYRVVRSGETAALPALAIQYGDYALWQRRQLPAERLAAATQWWSDYLAGAPEAITLPFDRARPARMDHRGDAVPVHIDAAVAEALRALGQRHGATLFMVLETALAVLLYRIGAGRELVIGTATANRPRRELEELIGFFVNTVALRHSLDPSASFEATLAQGREAILSALEQGHVPFEAVVEAARPARSLSHHPLVQVMMVLQNWADGALDAVPSLDGVRVEALPEATRRSRFDLELSLIPRDGGLEGVLFYASQLFDRSTAERLAGMYRHLLTAVAATPRTAIGDLPLIDNAERRRLLVDFNAADRSADAAADGTVLDLFAAQVAERPDAAAVVVDGDTTLTYRDLDAAANRLARHLMTIGVGRETVVGVCLDRSATLIVTFLAIWKAGGAYLPLAPDEPAARRTLMIDQAEAQLVITAGDRISEFHGPTLAVDASSTDLAELADTPLPVSPRPVDLAYVIYTSGSTGTPKGVAVGHNSLARYLAWSRALFAPKPLTTVPVTTQLTFDITVTSLWLALISGCRIRLLEPRDAGRQLVMCTEQIGLVKLTPSQFADFIRSLDGHDSEPNLPEVLVVGGDVLSTARIRPLIAHNTTRIVNHYGPTEATVGCIVHTARPEDLVSATVPIGRPAPAVRAYVVNARFEPQPLGVSGELLVGGAQLARGYLGAPGLTAQRFIADPFSGTPGARLYRTGDLARWRDDGTLEFLGRIDHQVKIRGIRVEPAEVEAALAALDNVASCAVIGRQSDDPTQTHLVAYLVPDATLGEKLDRALGGDDPETDRTPRTASAAAVFDLDAIRTALKTRLPDAMVPAAFVAITHLPLNAAGKVDRTALPETSGDVVQHRYAGPRDELESLVCAVMRDVIAHDRIDLERVGLDDNFFDIGGHSIFAAQLCGRLGKALARDVPVRWLFEAPTPRELVERLRHDDPEHPALPTVEPVDRDQPIPASFEQERMWLLNEIHKGRPVYNEGIALLLSGSAIDANILRSTIQEVINRYEVLRTRIDVGHGAPKQVILPTGSVNIEYDDWIDQNLTIPEIRSKISSRATALVNRQYDLANESPCRILVIRTAPNQFAWILAMHHAAVDNWSMSHILLRDFVELYDAQVNNRPPTLANIVLHYADYAAWQRLSPVKAAQQRQLDYWRKRLSDLPNVPVLPSDRSPAEIRDRRGARLEAARFTKKEWRAIERFAVRHDCSPFMVFAAALACVLARTTGNPDVVIGTPHVSRPHPDLWEEFGYFGNTLILRSRVSEVASFEQLLTAVRADLIAAMQHQDVPVEQVLAAVGRNASALRLLLVMHAFHDSNVFGTADLRFELLDIMPPVAKHDLTVDIQPGSEGVGISIEYATDIFDKGTVRRIGAMLHGVIFAAVSAPRTAVCDLPLIDEAERRRLLVDFNAADPVTEADAAAEGTALDRFTARVAERPDVAAVVDGDTTLTYRDLDAAASRLARLLVASGVGPETVVGVCLDRSATLIVCLLAIWKAGGAYLPLAHEEPPVRRRLMTDQAGAQLVITGADRVPEFRGRTLAIDAPETQQHLADVADTRLPTPPGPDSLAYLIYTSGSTGTPKGVAVQHRGITRLVCEPFHDLDKRGRILHAAHVAFDAATFEMWVPLTAGGALVVSRDKLLKANDFHAVVDRHHITGAWLTAGLFHAWMRGDPSCFSKLKTLLVGGEQIDPVAVARLKALNHGPKLVNGYGPTETVTFAATADLVAEMANADRVALGRPICQTKLYVCDKRLAPVPVGVSGELLIGGSGVTRGYLGAPGLTAQRFIADPFSGTPGARLYRTGDLARWRDDGTLEFLGRIDHQVKIRGIRVEPAEVEAALAALDSVASCAVIGRQSDDPTQTHLVAYLVPDATLGEKLDRALGGDDPETDRTPRTASAAAVFDLDAIRTALKTRLPDAMVPAAFVAITHLPLNAAGKVDRAALPETSGDVVQHHYAGPRDELESLVCAVMRDVIAHDRIDLERVGLDDNFFDIGGHSIFAAQLCGRLGNALARDVPVRWLFEAPTPRELVERLRHDDPEHPALPPVEPVDRDQPIPASFEQERMWLLNEIHKGRPVYNEGIALAFSGSIDTDALVGAIQDILDRYDVLRTRLVDAQGTLYQRVDPAGALAVVFEDWTARDEPSSALHTEARQRCIDLQIQPYDLAAEYPCRALVIKLTAELHVWCLAVHHIAADNWSMSHIMPSELMAAYDARRRGGSPDLPVLRLSFVDYAFWQRSSVMNDVMASQLRYWTKKLQGAPATLDLPVSRPRPLNRDYTGNRITAAQLPWETWRQIESVAAAQGASPFMFFTAIIWTLLARLSGSNDITIGTPHTTKPDAALWPVFGYFGNTLALRGTVDPQSRFADLLTSARTTVLEALAHQEVPFEAVVEAIGARPANTTPLFQVLVVMHAFLNEAANARDDMQVSVFAKRPQAAKYDIVIDINPTGSGVRVDIAYATDIYDAPLVRRLGAAFQSLTQAAIAAPEIAIGNLPLTEKAELRTSVGEADTQRAFESDDSTVVDLFRRQATSNPAAIAVIDGGTSLSYAALEATSNRLARHLAALGVREDTTVGVCLERSGDLVVTILAIWKAGGVYLPLSPNEPPARQRLICEDAGVRLVVTQAVFAQSVGAAVDGDVLVVDLPATRAHINSLDDAPPATDIPSLNRPAYIIYTSGSTGLPKGVLQPHITLRNLIHWAEVWAPRRAAGVIVFHRSISFDGSIRDITCALCLGASLMVVRSSLEETDFGHIEALRLPVNLYITPSQFRYLDAGVIRRLASLQELHLTFAGELLSVDSAIASRLRMLADARLYNDYGPTETHAVASSEIVADDRLCDRQPDVGRVAVNTRAYVVDASLERQPIGVPGELLIGGTQLAHGYVGRPGQTAGRFIADPFSGSEGGRLYRTGDRAVWCENGTLQILGRLDNQLKIRGMRIEPGEIEAILKTQPNVQACVVVPDRASPGDISLIAYLVPKHPPVAQGGPSSSTSPRIVPASTAFELTALRSALRQRLPEHMVPSRFVGITHLPLTGSGKLDRAALPGVLGESAREEFVAPVTDVEQAVAEAFEEVLGSSPAGREDDFFALGGHSLLAVRLCLAIARLTGRELPARRIFEARTVCAIAEQLQENTPQEPIESLVIFEPRSRPPADIEYRDQPIAVSQSRGVILTGATGFLGRHILRRLIDQQIPATCLVRAANEHEAMARLQHALEDLGAGKNDLSQRSLRAIAVDYAHPRFGLSEDTFDALADGTDTIVHCAAQVHFLHRAQELVGPNVTLVEDLLDLSVHGNPKTFCHISTLGVFGPATVGQISESTVVPKRDPHRTGYATTKAWAEQRVELMRESGLRATILRPALILGNSQRGIINPHDAANAFFGLCVAVGCVPRNAESGFRMVPIDAIADAIVRVLDRPALLGRNLHLSSWPGVTHTQLQDAARRADIELDAQDGWEWARRCKALINARPDHPFAWYVNSQSTRINDTAEVLTRQFLKPALPADLQDILDRALENALEKSFRLAAGATLQQAS